MYGVRVAQPTTPIFNRTAANRDMRINPVCVYAVYSNLELPLAIWQCCVRHVLAFRIGFSDETIVLKLSE